MESRLSRTRRPPFGVVATGDRVAFKISGARFIGVCRVTAVREFAGLAPSGVRRLERWYGRLVQAPAAYWAERTASRYAVLIWLAPLQPLPRPPRVPRQHGGGWVVAGPHRVDPQRRKTRRRGAWQGNPGCYTA